MPLAKSKVTSQGQISVPAEVRRKLGVGPGSVLEWDQDGDKIVVRRSGKYSSVDIHRALFLNHKDLTVQDSDAVAAALDLFRSRPALGFSDCLLLQLARKAGHLPLATFDRALGKVDGTQWLRA